MLLPAFDCHCKRVESLEQSQVLQNQKRPCKLWILNNFSSNLRGLDPPDIVLLSNLRPLMHDFLGESNFEKALEVFLNLLEIVISCPS